MKNVALASSCKPEELYEIMTCTGIVSKNKVKKAPLPETSELMQIDGEILALLCSDDSWQILLIFGVFSVESVEQNGANISPQISNNELIFDKRGCLHEKTLTSASFTLG